MTTELANFLSKNFLFDLAKLEKVADEYGLNYTKLLTCVEYAEQVLDDITLGQASGVTGTPAVMIRLGDGAPQFISEDGMTYNRGGVDYAVLARVIEAAQGELL